MREPPASGTDAGLLAGFHLDQPAPAVAELAAIGEQWAPGRRPMTWHSHAVWEIYVQIAGQSVRRSQATLFEMRPGDAFVAPPGVRHRVVNRGPAAQHNAFVRFDLAPLLRRHPGWAQAWRRSDCAHLPRTGAIEAALRRLVREVSTAQAWRDDGVRGALDDVVLEVTRAFSADLSGEKARGIVPLPEPVRRAKALLDAGSDEAWSLPALALRAGISPSHLGALFRAHLGVPPHRYQLGLRIARAQHMLQHTDAPITDIALELGFASSQHFARAFRAATGTTARHARRVARG